jgi:hypothetical protein
MKHLYLLLFLSINTAINAQNILLVNDNDLIFDNTDSITDALDLSVYAGDYDYWNIPDSGGVYPTSSFMDNYNLIIWYCSTDGTGLKLWEDGVSGNDELVTHMLDGYPVWIIGADMLYQQYGSAPDAFSTGDFAYDYMGISNYNVQSYGDDGNLGVPQVDELSGGWGYFPDSLLWAFPTAWWVDGVTGLSGTESIYEMGPSSYALSGEVSMLRSQLNSVNVMSTFFDPALINNQTNRIDFLESGIAYLLMNLWGIDENEEPVFTLYPNPVNEFRQVINRSDQTAQLTINGVNGTLLLTKNIAPGETLSLDLHEFATGVYIVKTMTASGDLWTEKLVIY